MDKTDLKKELKHLYKPSKKEFTIVDVPSMHFLMIDGHGNPNTSSNYQEAIEALYAMAYGLKFASKKQLEKDYSVMPLEGLWWVEDIAEFSLENKDDWSWTMMIMQPEWITAEMVETVMEAVARKKNPPALPHIRFDAYHEGRAAQIMYIGAYNDEHPTIARMHAFIEEEGYALSGKHHEIYLNDARRTAPEKLKTILRQPIRSKA